MSIVKFYVLLPKTTEAQVLGKQVLRSGTSIGAHYREAYRSRSDAEFISKLEVGLQELDETSYWLELLTELPAIQCPDTANLLDEADQLTAIFTTCVKNVKARRRSDEV